MSVESAAEKQTSGRSSISTDEIRGFRPETDIGTVQFQDCKSRPHLMWSSSDMRASVKQYILT